MGFQIIDGTGTGKVAKVDSENRLKAASDIRTQIAFISQEKQQAYVLTTGQLAVTVTNGLMLYLRNTSQTSIIHVSNIFLSWSGGNTNHDRVVFAQLEGGLTAPITNTAVATVANLNSGSGNVAPATALRWDGVGTGMIGGSPGLVVADALFNRGFSQIPLNDAQIIQFNDAIGIRLRGEEVGTAAITMSFYFEELT